MQAVNDKVIVKEIGKNETSGGLLLPEGSAHDEARYEVVSVGKGRMSLDGTFIPLCVEVGDLVLVAQNASEFMYKGKKYAIMSESAIGAIIKKS